MHMHVLAACLIVHHHIIISKRLCRTRVLLIIVILIAALIGLSMLRFLVVVLLLLKLLLLRLLGALLRLWCWLLLEWNQYMLPIPCGSQSVHHMLVLLLRGLLLHHRVLGRLMTPDDGSWRLLLRGLSCHVHGAM